MRQLDIGDGAGFGRHACPAMALGHLSLRHTPLSQRTADADPRAVSCRAHRARIAHRKRAGYAGYRQFTRVCDTARIGSVRTADSVSVGWFAAIAQSWLPGDDGCRWRCSPEISALADLVEDDIPVVVAQFLDRLDNQCGFFE